MPGFRTTAAVVGSAVLLLAGCDQQSGIPPNSADRLTSPEAAATSTPASAQETPTAAPAPTAPARPPAITPVLVRAVADPIAVPATDGKVHLAYELIVTNVLGGNVTLTSLAVMDGDRPLVTLAGDELGYWTRVLGAPTNATTRLGPGQSAAVWLDVAVDPPSAGSASIPEGLTHTIGLTIANPNPPLFPQTVTANVAPVRVQNRQPVEIAPPLTGPSWLDGDSCCDMSAHRMALNPIDGQLWAAERFAIDYVQLDPTGRVFNGDASRLESYPYFGANIHAVADGPVLAVVDGLPEQVPGVAPTGLTLDQYAGNHIVQDLGDGNFALYAHLQTGSVRVKPGDRLGTGQVIALLGNTGNSDAPHLHFHVMNGPDPLRADGLPFVFSSFRLDSRLGSMGDIDALVAGRPAPLEPGVVAREETAVSPLNLDVMTYADR